MLERVRCSTARDVILPAVEAESDFLYSLNIQPKVLEDPASYSQWLLQQHEILAPVYSNAIFEAKRNSRMAGGLFRGRTFQAYAGTKLRLKTWLESQGDQVVLPEDQSRSVLQELTAEGFEEKLKQFEKNPSFRSAKNAMKGGGYKPDGLLIGKRIHPVEFALNPDQKYVDNKVYPFQLALDEYEIFDKETKIQLISPNDSDVGYFSERIMRKPDTDYDFATVHTFLREVYYAYRPDPQAPTLSEHGFNLLFDSSKQRHNKRRMSRQQRQQFAYRPSRP